MKADARKLENTKIMRIIRAEERVVKAAMLWADARQLVLQDNLGLHTNKLVFDAGLILDRACARLASARKGKVT